MKLRVLFALMAGVAMTIMPTGRVAAAGGGDIEFSVTGQLGTFPCPLGCTTSFTGSGSGGGQTETTIGGDTYDATYTIEGGAVTGTASYTEPAAPFCPLVGSASNPAQGTVTLSGGATGIIYKTSTPTFSGTVTGVSFTLSYTYERVGFTAEITVTGGSVMVSYFFPGTGSGSFTQPLEAGAGGGLFQVEAGAALADCSNPGPLNFTLSGDAVAVAS